MIKEPGKIYLVSTPIGNMEDITFRAVRVLKEVDIIFAEDTRTSAKLLRHYNISGRVESLFSRNEKRKIPYILSQLGQGLSVAVISDAGTPGISDPAGKLVKEAVINDFEVIPIPGPTALISGLIVSGLPTDRFYFQGFLPLKKGKKKTLKFLAEIPHTIVIYESIHRLPRSLKEIQRVMGDRYICIAREITKMHETFYRGYISEFTEKNPDLIVLKGEIVLIVAGTVFKPLDGENNQEFVSEN